jgi:two-component sensor histidine kinase
LSIDQFLVNGFPFMTEHILVNSRSSTASEARRFVAFTDQAASLSEVNHRISSNIALLASTVSMRAAGFARRAEPIAGTEVATALNEITARIATVGHLHRLLSNQPGAADAKFGAHLRELCRLFISVLAVPGQVELIETGTADCLVSVDDFLPLSLIVTEVVTNSLKYAHPAGAPGKLTVGCHREPGGSIVIEVADDGVGFPEGFDLAASGGIGARTIHVLAQQIGAEISFDSRPTGLRFALRLPVADDSSQNVAG